MLVVFYFLLGDYISVSVFVSVSVSVFVSLIFCCFFFQSFGIGYKQVHPDGQVRVHSNDPRPVIRVKPDTSSNFRRYSFVDTVLSLDPVGRLGLLASDYKVIGFCDLWAFGFLSAVSIFLVY